MTGSDAFGGCLGIVAAAILGQLIFGPLGALLGALISAVVVGLVVSANERARARDRRKQDERRALEQRWEKEQRPAIAPRQAAPPSVESALEQLEQLRSNDLITPGEYQAKKKEILDRL